jgi:hypothetical protein
MAALLILSELDLSNLTKGGVVRRKTENRVGRRFVVYDWRETVPAYIRHLRAPGEEAKRQFLLEKSLTQQIIRAQKELELARARGEMIDGNRVDREVMSLLTTIKNHMRALPSRIASLLEGKTRAEIHAIVKKYVDLTLREAGDFDTMQLRSPSGGNGNHDRGSAKRKTRTRR